MVWNSPLMNLGQLSWLCLLPRFCLLPAYTWQARMLKGQAGVAGPVLNSSQNTAVLLGTPSWTHSFAQQNSMGAARGESYPHPRPNFYLGYQICLLQDGHFGTLFTLALLFTPNAVFQS